MGREQHYTFTRPKSKYVNNRYFRGYLGQGDVFRKVIGSITEMATEATFYCSEEGVNLQATSKNYYNLVSLQLRKGGFDSYRCDKAVSLGMNLTSLTKVLKCMNTKDSVTLRSQDNADSCSFVFEGEAEDLISNFDLKLKDIDEKHIEIPEWNYKCMIRMPADEFQRICRDMQDLGDTRFSVSGDITIAATKEDVKFSTQVSGDYGSTQVSGGMTLRNNNNPDESQQVTIELEENITQTFTLRYQDLNFFTKATPLAKSVNICMSPDLCDGGRTPVPMMVEYAMPELGHVRYYLSPKSC